MTGIKRSFFWAALYLAIVLILGETDYTGRPVINFASYFYLAVMIAVPVTLFFPSISKVHVYIPLLVWGGIYMVLLQTIDRTKSTTSIDFPIIVLEVILLEVGVWFAHQLAVQIGYAESLMDALALGAFPSRVQEIETESQRIKIELTRSRRYQRPLSLLVIEVDSEVEHESPTPKMMKSVQHDLMHRFSMARVGQIIDDLIRQTDLFLKDRRGRYIVLCSETNSEGVESFAKRIERAIKEKTGLQIVWGFASFPDEALTIDDLMLKARERITAKKSFDGKVELTEESVRRVF